MANILYIGHDKPSSTSAHRANALQRLGHSVRIHDPYKAVLGDQGMVFRHLHYRTGYFLLQSKVEKWLKRILGAGHIYDLIWVDNGELFGTGSLQLLKSLKCPVLLYNIDDPTGKRDKGRFDSLLRALPLYDHIVVVRNKTAEECLGLGASSVTRVTMSYDEAAHMPYGNIEEIPASLRSDVAFIGTWMRYEKRDEFLVQLIELGVPVSIWGDRWKKSPYWNILHSAHRGGALGGRDYVGAIQGAKICLGFLSKGNRDQHTTRSLEIPYAGGLLCAERTSEHLGMYKEGVEAAFWSDSQECARVCKRLLSNDLQREKIRLAGMQKVRSIGVGNEDICRDILKKLNLS